MSRAPIDLRRFEVVFWDFDGVIKESVEAKTEAFVALFAPHGAAVAHRVREHHERHGGVSRFDKIPLYLRWAGLPVSGTLVQEYCERFSRLVMHRVIDATWVPWAREYLQRNHDRQYFALVTGTPQDEIEQILRALKAAAWFRKVCGAPTAKHDAIAGIMRSLGTRSDNAVSIGDSESDLAAARTCGISFLLRRTPLNQHLQHPGLAACDDFAAWIEQP